MEPMPFLSQGKEDYLISIALMQKSLQISSTQKIEEIKLLAELIGLEVGKTVSKIF